MPDIIGWLQLSDLHFPAVKDRTSENVETRILNAVGDHSFGKDRVDFVVITGDYRNIWQASDNPFGLASSFIIRLMKKLNLDIEKDLFIIPGNHDVDRTDECIDTVEWEKREQAIEKLSLAENGDAEDEEAKKKNQNPVYRSYLSILHDVRADLKKLFAKYSIFVNGLYSGPGRKSIGPAEDICLSVWKDKNGTPRLRLMHLNTALASNKERNHKQVLDDTRLGELANEDADLETKLPTVVLAHHSFYDLHPSLRQILVERMNQMNCWVWLAGDRHINNQYDLESEISRNINTSPDDRTWPNIICGKGMGYDGDDWAELELMLYSWDGEKVDANRVVWEEQGRYRKNIVRRFHMYSAITYGLYDFLFRKLCEVCKNHPSFELLSHVEKTLFPRAIERFQIIGTSDRFTEATSVEDLIKSTWNKPERSHILLEGEGGIGKTVMLLSLATDSNSFAKDLPAIYIPAFALNLNEESPIDAYIDKYIGSDSKEYYKKQVHSQMRMNWANGPRLLLLLDGFNEITIEKQMIIANHLKDWLSDNKGVQLVATSRDSMKGSLIEIGNIHDVKLLPLLSSSVKDFLAKTNVPYPQKKEMESLIQTPLMLMLYSGTKKVDKKIEDCEIKKNSLNPGKLMWNYVQLEEHSVFQRCKKSLLPYYATVMLCEVVIPYVAYEMKMGSQFQLHQEVFDDLFNNAYNYYEMNYKNDTMATRVKLFCSKYNCGIVSMSTMREELNRLCILKRLEVDNASEKEIRYQFVHQSFRDYFASIHQISQIEMLQKEESPVIESIWGKEMDCVSLSFQGDLLRWSEIKKLWKCVKQIGDAPEQRTMKKAWIDNVFRLIRMRGEKEYLELDLSNLDLSDFVMYQYRDETKRLFFPKNRELLLNTGISLKTIGQIDYSSRLTYVGLSFDGSQCYCASANDIVSCWDLMSGRCEWTRELGNPSYIIASITPDGKKCVCVSKEGNVVQLWNIMERVVEQKLVDVDPFSEMAISPDGKKVILGHRTSLTIWNLQTGVKENEFLVPSYSGAIEYLFVNSGNKCICVRRKRYTNDWNVAILDISNGDYLFNDYMRWNCYFSRIEGRISINTKGDKIYRLDRFEIIEVSFRKNYIERRVVDGEFDRFAVDREEKRLVTVNNYGILQIWNISSGRLEGTLNDRIGKCSSLVVSPDGQKCLYESEEGTVYIIGMSSCECEVVFDTGVPNIVSMGVSADETIFTTASNDGTIRNWYVENGICKNTLSIYNKGRKALYLTPTGDCAFFDSVERGVIKWDLANTTEVHWPPVKSVFAFIPGKGAAIDPSGTRLACYDGKLIQIWNIENGEIEYAFPQGKFDSLCLSEKGRRGALSMNEGDLYVWDVEKKEKKRYILSRRINRMVTDHYGDKVICAIGNEGEIEVVNAHTGGRIFGLNGHSDRINYMCITSDGKKLLSASSDKTIRVWDLVTGECVRILEGHEKAVMVVQVLEKSEKCVSSSMDGTIRIWDLSGECCNVIRVLEGVSISGIDLSKAIFDSDYTKHVIQQNGAIV